MSNVLKGFKLAAALILLCIAIGMVVFVWKKSLEELTPSQTELINLTKDVGIEDLIQNTGKDISGAKVVTLAEKYCSVYPLVFVTGEMPGGFYDISYIRETTNKQYVNPNKIFRLEIDKYPSGDPKALIFLQAGCSKPTYDLEVAAAYVHKSQMLYTKLIAERNLQENLDIYENSIKRFAEADYKVLTKKGEQKTEEYWKLAGDVQLQQYDNSSQGLR